MWQSDADLGHWGTRFAENLFVENNADKKSRKKCGRVMRTWVTGERGLRQGPLCTPVARAGSQEFRPRAANKNGLSSLRVQY
ncbi:hypothetical protein QE152_g29085 [Popillia japonica]|uniref:Uncharacterized protein n=1 Tax=Popillia japonica TaxID=7064 RepID=A0AAW1JIT0_POPJA